MSKKETILIAIGSLLLGVIIGFFIAPIKKGLEFGNNSGNTTNYYGKEEEETVA